jgi:NiFe hydrogenase small subunit HydA
MGLDGQFLRLGPKGKTGIEIAKEVTSKAAATICIGSCSSFGNVQAASPNPTDAKGVSDAIGVQTVNIAGCPPSPQNFVGTVLHFLMFGALPPVDNLGRPVWAYGKRIHDYCERRPHYDAGEYVEEWGDEGAKKGWCLYKMGCKGPYTYGNCAKVRFNDGTSGPSWPATGAWAAPSRHSGTPCSAGEAVDRQTRRRLGGHGPYRQARPGTDGGNSSGDRRPCHRHGSVQPWSATEARVRRQDGPGFPRIAP